MFDPILKEIHVPPMVPTWVVPKARKAGGLKELRRLQTSNPLVVCLQVLQTLGLYTLELRQGPHSMPDLTHPNGLSSQWLQLSSRLCNITYNTYIESE